MELNFTGNKEQLKLHNQVTLKDLFERTSSRRWRLMSAWLIDNTQVRFLAGWTQHWRAPASRVLLNAAKKNLREGHTVFRLQDDYDEILRRIAGAFEWEICPGTERRQNAYVSKKTLIQQVLLLFNNGISWSVTSTTTRRSYFESVVCKHH